MWKLKGDISNLKEYYFSILKISMISIKKQLIIKPI